MLTEEKQLLYMECFSGLVEPFPRLRVLENHDVKNSIGWEYLNDSEKKNVQIKHLKDLVKLLKEERDFYKERWQKAKEIY